MRVFLSGMMGTGKTLLAQELSRALNVPCVDLDREIEKSVGRSISQIFADDGETRFREAEERVLDEQLKRNPEAVFALGGGTVTRVSVRRRLLSEGCLVTLEATPDVIEQRVRASKGRPLLATVDPRATIEQLMAERAPAYAECHARLNSQTSPEVLIQSIIKVLDLKPIVVPLGVRTTQVYVGAGLRSQLGVFCRGLTNKLVMVTDENVFKHWHDEVSRIVSAEQLQRSTVCLKPGEEHKTLEAVTKIWQEALSASIDRGALVLSLGGGVAGDLAGFAASTLLRGLPVAHVPTTLLAMVDSAVGGKTGFDMRQGKNLIGTFHQPRFVLCDTDFLKTLSEADFRSGLAEAVKSAWLAGAEAFDEIENQAPSLLRRDASALNAAIRMSIGLKAQIVAEDELETTGKRMWLNFGHTLAHAIEAAQGYQGLRHGEAVSLGMVAAGAVAVSQGKMDQVHWGRLTKLLRTFGLPVDFRSHLDDATLEYLRGDKKVLQDKIRFVLPAAPGVMHIETQPCSSLVENYREAAAFAAPAFEES